MNIFDAIANQSVGVTNNQVKNEQKQVQQAKPEYKPDIIDICSQKIINNRDLTDTVTIPRHLFKGYFCLTVGTTINAISGMLKNKNVSKGMTIAGSLISIFGTYNFVKPFLKPKKELTKPEK